MITYTYASVPIAAFIGVTMIYEHEQPNSYLSDDYASRTVKRLLSEGYRIISTDHGFAVFEKKIDPAMEQVGAALDEYFNRIKPSETPCQSTPS